MAGTVGNLAYRGIGGISQDDDAGKVTLCGALTQHPWRIYSARRSRSSFMLHQLTATTTQTAGAIMCSSGNFSISFATP